MPRGFYTQTACVLTDGGTTIVHVRDAVAQAGFSVIKELPAAERWELSGPSIVVSHRPEVNGTVVIDVIDRPWPDSMGDPKLDPVLFGAWGMGQFGPFTYPGGLNRAAQHSWSWKQGRDVAREHRGVVRLRMTYAGGLPAHAPVNPEHRDPLAELTFLTRLVIALGSVPGALCYFNPNGEVLRDFVGLKSVYQACSQQQKQPMLLWSNVRLFQLGSGLGFMDTVGNEQFDASDIEVVYPIAEYEPGDIDYYMRNVTHYLLGCGRELRSGEAIDGPGEQGLSWMIDVPESSMCSPPRRVLRLFPKAMERTIREALAGIRER